MDEIYRFVVPNYLEMLFGPTAVFSWSVDSGAITWWLLLSLVIFLAFMKLKGWPRWLTVVALWLIFGYSPYAISI